MSSSSSRPGLPPPVLGRLLSLAASRQRISVTPIAKLDAAHAGNGNGNGLRVPAVDEEECVGCNLCSLVCPVDQCITMVEVATGKPKETQAMREAGRVYAKPGDAS